MNRLSSDDPADLAMLLMEVDSTSGREGEVIALAERLLGRGGWWTIAFGRAIPGLRYLTVIACGLFKVPYLRFLTAHMVGSSVYIGVFLALGAIFGPRVAEYLHLPALELRLVWLLALALGLPILLAWMCYRGHASYSAAPSRRRTFGALLLASIAGATSMAAAWAAAGGITGGGGVWMWAAGASAMHCLPGPAVRTGPVPRWICCANALCATDRPA